MMESVLDNTDTRSFFKLKINSHSAAIAKVQVSREADLLHI